MLIAEEGTTASAQLEDLFVKEGDSPDHLVMIKMDS